MSSQIWNRTILAVAAAASIATTVAPVHWNSNISQPFTTVLFDSQQRTKAVYAIHSEIDGPGPYKDLNGTLTANLLIRSTSGLFFEQRMRVTLTSLTNPAEPVIEDLVITSPLEHWVDLPAWGHCALPPCAEDFELTVELMSSTDQTGPLELSGSFETSSFGDDYELEHTTTSTMTVTLLP
jgi:hypothetical protein